MDFVIQNNVLCKYKGHDGAVVIPEGVTKIGSYAFHNCRALQSVTIQANACKIGELAFQNSHHHVLIAPHIPISGFPDINKPAVCAGFAKLYCDQFPLSEEIRAGYLAYIRDQRKFLYDKAMEYLPLLQLMAAEKMILPEDFEELFQDALQKGGSERTALLLEYRHKCLGPAD